MYNAETFIAKTLDSLDEFLRGLGYSAELIIVNDCSADDSLRVVNDWQRGSRPYPVQVISHEKNRGKGATVASGMLAAAGRYRVFLDADLAYSPSQLLRIVEALEGGSDVATACRVHPDSRYTISPAFFHYLYTRHLASRLINFALRHTLIRNCRDSQAGLKGFREKAADAIFSRQIIDGFSFDIEALYLAEKMGLCIREVAIDYRYFSEPTTVVFMQDAYGILRDVVRILRHRLLGKYDLPQKTGLKELVINADDYGMTIPVSRGILKGIASGAIQSTSVMTNSPDFEKAMDELTALHPHPDVGLHATLTWGRPLTDPKRIPSIVDKDGKFLPVKTLIIRAIMRKISEEEVYIELRAQCERLSKRWPDIGHVNGHHHVHTFPIIRKAVERVAREFDIRVVRAPREGRWAPMPWYDPRLTKYLIPFFSASRPAYWRGRGFLSTDHFGGFSLGGGRNLEKRWIRTLKALPDGTNEIMVHPGYVSDNDDSYNKQREEEVNILSDPAFKKIATAAGVNLVPFHSLTHG